MKYRILKILLPVIVLQYCGVVSWSQTCPRIPNTYSWNTQAEYERDSRLVRSCLEWLCIAPMAENFEKRSEANAFVLEWLSGSPSILVDIDSRTLPFIAQNEELIFPVIHGMALYQMNHPQETDKVILHARGLEVLAMLVKKDETLRKEEYLREMLKAARKKKLENWVCNNFSG